MKQWIGVGVMCGLILIAASAAGGLEGEIRTHDPSTVIVCEGKYYAFSTGRGIPIMESDDGWTWKRGGHVFDAVPADVLAVVPLNKGALVWAPDICKHDGKYYLYYSISSWGSNVSAVGLMTSPTLNAAEPAYKWTDGGVVVNSVTGENLNAIDPGVLQAPDGTMWLTYGSYIGNVEVLQLDPKTGGRIAPDSPRKVVSSQSEASDMIYHEGYYYLLVNRGSCCQGASSTYNIRMGRAKVPTGPFLDRYGEDMAHGGGDLFLAAEGDRIGPGHFGLLEEEGVEKFSCHYESGPGKHGTELDIRPLLWRDGWPMAGENVATGTYQVRCMRNGLNVQTAVPKGEKEAVLRADRYIVKDEQQWDVTRVGAYFTVVNHGKKMGACRRRGMEDWRLRRRRRGMRSCGGSMR